MPHSFGKILTIALAWMATNFMGSQFANAHEYFLLPEQFRVETNKPFGVSHFNGMRFKGNAYPWISSWNIRSEIWQNGEKKEIRGKDGDRPALTISAIKPGLVTIIHQSNPSTLTFRKWDKFTSYLADEGLEKIAQEHLARGIPKEGFKESYARYAKTLVQVGDSNEGMDAPTGLMVELVAQANPYSLPKGAPLTVQLLFEGKPLAGAAVKSFVGQDTEPRRLITTDENGLVDIPDLGKGPYLLNAVVMTPPQSPGKEAKDAAWESFWASLTFER